MLDLVKGIMGNEEMASKEVAKERLRLVLIHDRIGVSPEIIDDMKEELIEVISKYLEIEDENLEMELEQDDDSMALVANIPVRNLKKIHKNKRS
ncbi:cell division topological specificity factor MinE [Halobacteroides halobius DSM 5150]|uniref:Cell division topological specificity factor n=1 Tax=Halobacteroides halobius (strain ATCC 35273 / DSM 5150 / MD-1) TaxID=748449 RepID=L0KCT5_HALHC|nr:cell division topological specificity factor MinE [Halobacteroides halobius]AGB41888.1 cell division topological specificity factor MinE [Halobacteroides halobius DSM 5150]